MIESKTKVNVTNKSFVRQYVFNAIGLYDFSLYLYGNNLTTIGNIQRRNHDLQATQVNIDMIIFLGKGEKLCFVFLLHHRLQVARWIVDYTKMVHGFWLVSELI